MLGSKSKNIPAGAPMLERSISSFTLLALAGCAVAGKPVLTRTGEGLQPGATVTLAKPAFAGPENQAVVDSLRQALERQGFKIGEAGRYELSYAIALRPTATGLAPGDAGKDPQWISQPRRSSPWQSCKVAETRISIVAYEVATSKVAYRGTGEQQGCKLERPTIQSLVGALIAQSGMQ